MPLDRHFQQLIHNHDHPDAQEATATAARLLVHLHLTTEHNYENIISSASQIAALPCTCIIMLVSPEDPSQQPSMCRHDKTQRAARTTNAGLVIAADAES